jgi:hypothetical protein
MVSVNSSAPSSDRSQPVPAPAVGRRANIGYWVAVTVEVAALVVALVWGALLFADLHRHVGGFARLTLPGQATVPARSPTGWVVYYEGASRVPLDALGLVVRGSDGKAVPVNGYVGDVRYRAPADRVGYAVATFRAAGAGDYTVYARGPGTANSRLAIGDSYRRRSTSNVLSVGVVITAGLLLGATVTVSNYRLAHRLPVKPAPQA